MRDDLLTSCADIAAPAHEALQRTTTGAVPPADTPAAPNAQDPFPPPAPGTLPNAPRAPPWGIVPPAVQQLQPIGLSPLQAAAYLGTSRSRIYRLLRAGRLSALKQGIKTVVTLESLRTYAATLPVATFGHREETATAA
jgi:excisionase family DNA binding protein